MENTVESFDPTQPSHDDGSIPQAGHAERSFVVSTDDTKKLSPKDTKILQAQIDIMGTPPAGDEIVFLHSTFCQVGLPRSKPKTKVFERRSGTAAIRLEAGSLWDGHNFVEQPLPYGTKPRLFLLHIIREYLRTRDREIDIGDSMRDFLVNSLNIDASGGKKGGITAFKQQMLAFAACRMTIGYNLDDQSVRTRPERLVEELQIEAWQSGKRIASGPGRQRSLWPGKLVISPEFAKSIEAASVPLDARAIRPIQDSALAIDLYSFMAHRLYRLKSPARLTWANLRDQFGQDFADPKNFKATYLKALRDVLNVYPQAKIEKINGGLLLRPSQPPVPPKIQVVSGYSSRKLKEGPDK